MRMTEESESDADAIILKHLETREQAPKSRLQAVLAITSKRRDLFDRVKNNYLHNISTSDDVVKRGLVNILPNISKEIANEIDDAHIVHWIDDALSYSQTLFRDFKWECLRQMEAMRIIRRSNVLRERFVISHINKLPNEIERIIREYMLPKTRLAVLEAGFPDMEARLKQMTMPWLNGILKNCVYALVDRVNKKIYNMYSNTSRSKTYGDCIDYVWNKIKPKMSYRAYKKADAVERVLLAIRTCRDLVDCPTNYLAQELHKEAFHLFHSVLYLHQRFLEKKSRGKQPR
jgi:hypothetical protein